MKYSDISLFVPEDQAVEIVMKRLGFAEKEARKFLHEAWTEGRLRHRAPCGYGSKEYDRDDLERLCVRAEVTRPAGQRGPKPRAETQNESIDREFARMLEAGDVTFTHGGQSAAAKAIKAKLGTSYELNSIAKQIRGMYKLHQAKAPTKA